MQADMSQSIDAIIASVLKERGGGGAVGERTELVFTRGAETPQPTPNIQPRVLKPARRLPMEKKTPTFYGSSPYLSEAATKNNSQGQKNNPTAKAQARTVIQSHRLVCYDDLIQQYRSLPSTALAIKVGRASWTDRVSLTGGLLHVSHRNNIKAVKTRNPHHRRASNMCPCPK